jgi:hypothetical protein
MTEEQKYRYEERLGILCGSDVPTKEQERIAWEEALAWADEDLDPSIRAAFERIRVKARDKRRDYAIKYNRIETRPTHNDP